MNGQRLSLLITSVAGCLGTFLPWITISRGEESRWESGIGAGAWNAWAILFLFGMVPFGCLVGDKTQPVKGETRKTVSFLVVIAILIAIVDMYNFISGPWLYSRRLGLGLRWWWSGKDVDFSLGIGLYLIVISGSLLLILAFAVKGGGDYATRFPGRARGAAGPGESPEGGC